MVVQTPAPTLRGHTSQAVCLSVSVSISVSVFLYSLNFSLSYPTYKRKKK